MRAQTWGRNRRGGGHAHADQRQRALGGGLVDRGDRRNGIAAITYSLARQRIFVLGDGQNTERHVAIIAGEDGDHARQGARLGNVDVEDVGVTVGTAPNAADQGVGVGEIGRIFRRAADLFDTIDEGHPFAHQAGWHPLTHQAGWRVGRWSVVHVASPAATRTASMILV